MTTYGSNWFTLLLICTSAPLVMCGDWFDLGPRQVKCERVDPATEDMMYHLVSEFLSMCQNDDGENLININ